MPLSQKLEDEAGEYLPRTTPTIRTAARVYVSAGIRESIHHVGLQAIGTYTTTREVASPVNGEKLHHISPVLDRYVHACMSNRDAR